MDTDLDPTDTDDLYTYQGRQESPKAPRHRGEPQPRPAGGHPKPRGDHRA